MSRKQITFWRRVVVFTTSILGLVCEGEPKKTSLGRIGLWLFLIPTTAILWNLALGKSRSINWPEASVIVTGLLIFSMYNFGKKPQCRDIIMALAGRITIGGIDSSGPAIQQVTNVTHEAEVPLPDEKT